MSFTSNVSSTYTYRGNAEVNFFLNENKALTVTIDTDRLHIRSVESSEEDYGAYTSLFGDQDVMSKFATGQTKTRKEMESHIKDVWVKRWRQGNPYTGLAAFKKDTRSLA